MAKKTAKKAAKKKAKRKTTKKRRTKTSATILTPKKRREFLKTIAETGNVTAAAKLVGASRQGMYDVRRRDEAFAAEWDAAVMEASDALIAEARRRGFEGFDEPLHHKGELTGDIVRKYSDVLLIFLIKGRRPEFRDRVIEQNITAGPKATVIFESNGREVVE